MKNIKVINIAKIKDVGLIVVRFLDKDLKNTRVLELEVFRKRYTNKPIRRYLISRLLLSIKIKLKLFQKEIKRLFHYKRFKP